MAQKITSPLKRRRFGLGATQFLIVVSVGGTIVPVAPAEKFRFHNRQAANKVLAELRRKHPTEIFSLVRGCES